MDRLLLLQEAVGCLGDGGRLPIINRSEWCVRWEAAVKQKAAEDVGDVAERMEVAVQHEGADDGKVDGEPAVTEQQTAGREADGAAGDAGEGGAAQHARVGEAGASERREQFAAVERRYGQQVEQQQPDVRPHERTDQRWREPALSFGEPKRADEPDVLQWPRDGDERLFGKRSRRRLVHLQHAAERHHVHRANAPPARARRDVMAEFVPQRKREQHDDGRRLTGDYRHCHQHPAQRVHFNQGQSPPLDRGTSRLV